MTSTTLPTPESTVQLQEQQESSPADTGLLLLPMGMILPTLPGNTHQVSVLLP